MYNMFLLLNKGLQTSVQSSIKPFSLLFKVVDGTDGREVQLINRKSLRLLTSQLLALLMSQEKHVDKGLRVDELRQHYQMVHKAPLNPCEYGFLSLSELLKSLPYLVEVREAVYSRTSHKLPIALQLSCSCD